MTNNARKKETDEIEKGLKALASRFRSNDSVPDVPDDVFERGCSAKYHYDEDDYDIKDVQSHYPKLDANVIAALMERSDCDLFPSGLMIAGIYASCFFTNLSRAFNANIPSYVFFV